MGVCKGGQEGCTNPHQTPQNFKRSTFLSDIFFRGSFNDMKKNIDQEFLLLFHCEKGPKYYGHDPPRKKILDTPLHNVSVSSQKYVGKWQFFDIFGHLYKLKLSYYVRHECFVHTFHISPQDNFANARVTVFKISCLKWISSIFSTNTERIDEIFATYLA